MMAKLKIPCVFVLRVHACSSWKLHLENTAWFACSWPEFLKKISISRTRTCGHAFTARKCSCDQDGFRSDWRCLLSVYPLVRAELFFTILYPNAILIKSFCSNLDMCVNFYALTYSQLRILFADRDRKWNKSCFSVTLEQSFSFRVKSISVPDRAIECGWYYPYSACINATFAYFGIRKVSRPNATSHVMFSYVVIDLSLDSMHAFLIVLLHRTSEIAAWPSGNVLGLRRQPPRLQSRHGVHIRYREFDLFMSSCPEALPL